MDLIALTAIIAAGTKFYLSYKPREKDKLADNSFKANLSTLEDKKGLSLAKGIKLSPRACSEGIIIFAPTGEGKTTSIYFPALLDENIEGSLIVADPKGELYRETAHFQEKVCHRKVYVYAPFDPICSNQYNILEQCKSVTEVKQLAQNLLMNGSLSLEIQTGKKSQGIEWLQMSESLLTSALLYCKEKGYPLNSVERALELILGSSDEILDNLFKTATASVQKEYAIFKTVAGADRTAGSIKITLASNMNLFTDPVVTQTMKRTDFTAGKLRREKSVIYFIYPPYLSSYISPLMAPVYSQLINHSMECYKPNSLPLWFLGDEFANIGQLQNFPQVISTVRHYNIKMVICTQNLSQLYQLYGRENTNTILNNCKTKIILPSLTDKETLDYLSNLLGDQEVNVKNESQSSYSFSKHAIKLMDSSGIRQLKKDSLVIIAHNLPPVKAQQNIFYKDKAYTKKVVEQSLPIV